MKVVGTIINEANSLVGLRMEGKKSEFGEFSDAGAEKVTRDITLNELFANRFKNFQVAFDKDKRVINELGKFRLKDLPMRMYNSANGEMVNIDNSITLKKRMLVNGKLEGFEVVVGNRTAKYTIKDIIILSRLNKTANFYVSSTSKNGKTKTFLVGKAGTSLESLPAVELAGDKKTSKKAKTSTARDKSDVQGVEISKDFDILQLYDIINEANGIIIKLPSEDYKKSKPAEKKTSSEFISLGVGEIASPKPLYTEKSLNVNSNFKKVGKVDINMKGQPIPVYTYTVTSKHLFFNGRNYIDKLGIAVSEDKVEGLKNAFASSLSIEEYTDPVFTEPIRNLQGDKDKKLRFFKVDTSKLDVMNKNRAKGFILSNSQIKNLVMRLELNKARNKFLNATIKSTRETASKMGIKDPRPKYGIFAMYNDELLDIISEAGIDIFTGAFTKKEDSMEKVEAEAKRIDDMVNGKPVKEPEENYEVIYSIKGISVDKLTAKDILEKKEHPLVDDSLKSLVDMLEATTTLERRLQLATELKEAVEKEIYEIRKQLWCHKMASFSLGGFNGYCVVDKNNWEPVKTRKKNATAYACTDAGCDGLQIQLVGINMV